MPIENEEEYLEDLANLNDTFHIFDGDPSFLPPHKMRVSRWDEKRGGTVYLRPSKFDGEFDWVPVPTPDVALTREQIDVARAQMDLSDSEEIIYYDDPRLNGATVIHEDADGYKTYGNPTRQAKLDTNALWPVEARDFVVSLVNNEDTMASGWEDHSYLEIDVVPMTTHADGSEGCAEYEDEVQYWAALAKVAGSYFPHAILAEFEAATEEKIDEKVEKLLKVLPGADVHKEEPTPRPVESPAP
ncbi:hypothetical protein [Sulfitobacter sp. R18_1]|uniref:hypothetical protein n=1 Tax=Sulfitobacter sp. R18_1 TaxID=2821104 RepID=UPI001ADC7DC8|nr:hypothetical protein [Sulfitobacter sp. R18_1]MBO9428361.1 hypothetical protein [Sulfitobacter sp. R18_1]